MSLDCMGVQKHILDTNYKHLLIKLALIINRSLFYRTPYKPLKKTWQRVTQPSASACTSFSGAFTAKTSLTIPKSCNEPLLPSLLHFHYLDHSGLSSHGQHLDICGQNFRPAIGRQSLSLLSAYTIVKSAGMPRKDVNSPPFWTPEFLWTASQLQVELYRLFLQPELL